jgi:chromosome segregation ATPase
MNEQVPSTGIPVHETASGTRSPWLALVGAAAVLGICAGVYNGVQTSDLRRELWTSRQDNEAVRAKLAQSGTELQDALALMQQNLEATKQESSTGLTKAQQAATHHADVLAQREKEEARKLSEQLGQVRESADQATAKLEGISNDVGSVKTEVGSVRSDVGTVRTDVETAKTNIDSANTELQRIRGDMGVMSGLVATNGQQIQVLRDLGDRNIYEFTLTKSAGMQKVGDVQVALRNADAKRNRYTVDVLADDKRVEKKDRGANEPVQFYTAGTRQPYELVINSVKKDQVSGYLATPKVHLSRISPGTEPAKQ